MTYDASWLYPYFDKKKAYTVESAIQHGAFRASVPCVKAFFTDDDLLQYGRVWTLEHLETLASLNGMRLFGYVSISCYRFCLDRYRELRYSTLGADAWSVADVDRSRNIERLEKQKNIVKEYAKIRPKKANKRSYVTTVVLMTLDNYDYDYIAETLGTSRNAVRCSLNKFINRARRDLAHDLV